MAKPQPAQFKVDNLDVENTADSFIVRINGQRSGRPSQRLTLKTHCLKLSEVQISLTQKNKVINFAVNRINYLPTRGETRIHVNGLLYPGRYTITMRVAKTAEAVESLPKFSELLT